MMMYKALLQARSHGECGSGSRRWSDRAARGTERGSAVVEWLGISALSVALLVVLFSAMEQIGASVIEMIRGSLGV